MDREIYKSLADISAEGVSMPNAAVSRITFVLVALVIATPCFIAFLHQHNFAAEASANMAVAKIMVQDNIVAGDVGKCKTLADCYSVDKNVKTRVQRVESARKFLWAPLYKQTAKEIDEFICEADFAHCPYND